MLSGLGSLLWGGGRVEEDTASVDQTQASQQPSPPPPVSLLTQDADNGWVLVENGENGDSEATVVDAEGQAVMEERQQVNAVGIDNDDSDGDGQAEQQENQPHQHQQPGALQQHRANAEGQGVNVRVREPVRLTEIQELKQVQAAQRCQRQTSGRQLSKKALDCSNKSRSIRKHANSHSRVLRPSGQMNGRQAQRQY